MTNARLTLIVLVTRSVVRIRVKSSVFNRQKVSAGARLWAPGKCDLF